MTTFLGGKYEGVNLFRIMALRSAVKLEKTLADGKLPRMWRKSMTEVARKELGLPKGTKRSVVIEALDEAVHAQQQITK